MAFKTPYEFHHNFPKLAEESGFTFNTLKPRNRLDWNKIKSIELNSLIRERKFVLVEQHLHDVLDCALESEFDVRILDEGVVKMFRLAQLAIEYQQFCRHYLDRSVFVLREEISALIQELNASKKQLRDNEEEIKKLKRKTKHSFRPPLVAYGNENIANMILRTLANKTETFPSMSNVDMLQYNKCTYCDKVFLNQLYLKSHIARRHGVVNDLPEKDLSNDHNENQVTHVNSEITELKSKLKEMEDVLKTLKSEDKQTVVPEIEKKFDFKAVEDNKISYNETKDAEVAIANDKYLQDKFEEWKKEEREKYNEEINLLRTEILQSINTAKQKEDTKTSEIETDTIKHLHTTIKEQDVTILDLKQELSNLKVKLEQEEIKRKSEMEEQMNFWNKRVRTQSKENDLLLQKLKEASKDADILREQAEAERKNASEFQSLLKQYLSEKPETVSHNAKKPKNSKETIDETNLEMKDNHIKPKLDLKTLDDLHRTAQQLLNKGSISSSDNSSMSDKAMKNALLPNNIAKSPKSKKYTINKPINNVKKQIIEHQTKITDNNLQYTTESNTEKKSTRKRLKVKKQKGLNSKEEKLFKPSTGSPIKIVRAKITEEVNNRLVLVGIDPLKKGLPQSSFQKQRRLLQKDQELKAKKNSSHDKIRHSILAYLDSSISVNTERLSTTDVAKDRIKQAFSFSTMISNVKNKAKSLVKSNDINKIPINTRDAEINTTSSPLLKTSTSPYKSKSLGLRDNLKSTPDYFEKCDRREKSHKITDTIVSQTGSDESDSDDIIEKTNDAIQLSKSIENLIKSPIRRPSSANLDYKDVIKKRAENEIHNSTNRSKHNNINVELSLENFDTNSDDEESYSPLIKFNSLENIQNSTKQTKSVLKNASSASSLNKKKVIFDMDAIQMKSLSASPSQSITEKSESNEKKEMNVGNLRDEEWDISSIENEPLNNDTKIRVNSYTSPKIAELKAKIENQLARRGQTPSSAVVHGVDILKGPMARTMSLGGSNTSLGSSILDESDSDVAINNKPLVKPKIPKVKDTIDDLEISELSLDGLLKRNENGSF